jgi:hypothetical protein
LFFDPAWIPAGEGNEFSDTKGVKMKKIAYPLRRRPPILSGTFCYGTSQLYPSAFLSRRKFLGPPTPVGGAPAHSPVFPGRDAAGKAGFFLSV